MQVCACIVRVSTNGRAQVWQVVGERGRESRSPIFKFKSSLKTSASAFHAVVLEFTRRPAAQAEAARANYNGNVLCSKSLSSAWRMMPGRILCYVVMIIQWVVVYQSEQNDHRRDQRVLGSVLFLPTLAGAFRFSIFFLTTSICLVSEIIQPAHLAF